MSNRYNNFIFFSAGPVGDHAVQIDFANRFFEATGTPSLLIMKHPNGFLKDLSIPYIDHIKHLDFVGYKGFLRMINLTFLSIFQKNCYVLIFPIPAPFYLKLFTYFIHFFTRSRIVGFNLEGSKNFPVGKGYISFLGKNNVIPLLPEMFYKSANKMLVFLGYKEVSETPKIDYVFQDNIFKKFNILKYEYIAFHVSPSHHFRSLPSDRWNKIIKSVINNFPETKIVFTGTKNDIPFIKECIIGISDINIRIAAGETNAQELLTLYANAKVNIVVQTGNALLIAMLHAPSVVVNIKGTAMFYYGFNEKAKILFSEKDCICDPFETNCNMISYKGKEYMACLFNISDDEIIDAIIKKYKNNRMNETKVSVLTVTYGKRWQFLSQVASAVLADSHLYKLVIVNNASENSKEINDYANLHKEKVEVINNDINTGSAGGFATGLERIRNFPCDYVLLLDDDNVPESGFVESFLNNIKEIGSGKSVVLGNRNLLKDGDKLFYSGETVDKEIPTTFFEVFSIKKIKNFLQLFSKKQDKKDKNTFKPIVRVVSFAYGGAFLPIQAIKDAPLPDRRLFTYGDDIEYSWGVRASGYDLYFCSTPIIKDIDLTFQDSHIFGMFSPQTSDIKIFFRMRNSVIISLKHSKNSFSVLLNVSVWFIGLCIAVFLKMGINKLIIKRLILVKRAMMFGIRQDFTVPNYIKIS